MSFTSVYIMIEVVFFMKGSEVGVISISSISSVPLINMEEVNLGSKYSSFLGLSIIIGLKKKN